VNFAQNSVLAKCSSSKVVFMDYKEVLATPDQVEKINNLDWVSGGTSSQERSKKFTCPQCGHESTVTLTMIPHIVAVRDVTIRCECSESHASQPPSHSGCGWIMVGQGPK
jgi:hypothetical protein